MIRMILKYLWAQRHSNALLFAELVVVGIMLFYVTDSFVVAYRSYSIPIGFNTERSYVISMEGKNSMPVVGRDIKDSLDRFLSTRPEIEQLAYTYNSQPFSGSRNACPIMVNNVETGMNIRQSDARFPLLLGIVPITGRWFTDAEMFQNKRVCVISQNLQSFLKRPHPVGTYIKIEDDFSDSSRIIGVIADLKYGTYEDPTPTVFIPMNLQRMSSGWRIIVKVKQGKDGAFAQTLKLLSTDISQSMNIVVTGVNDFETMRDSVDMEQNNMLSNLFWCALFFLINVVLGIYVVFSGRIKKRVQELGLRMAVGSSRMGIIGLVLGEATMLLLLSSIPVLVVGGNLAYFGMLSPDSSLTVSRFVTVFLLTELILLVSVLFSVLLPAVRASKVQPAEALHYE